MWMSCPRDFSWDVSLRWWDKARRNRMTTFLPAPQCQPDIYVLQPQTRSNRIYVGSRFDFEIVSDILRGSESGNLLPSGERMQSERGFILNNSTNTIKVAHDPVFISFFLPHPSLPPVQSLSTGILYIPVAWAIIHKGLNDGRCKGNERKKKAFKLSELAMFPLCLSALRFLSIREWRLLEGAVKMQMENA